MLAGVVSRYHGIRNIWIRLEVSRQTPPHNRANFNLINWYFKIIGGELLYDASLDSISTNTGAFVIKGGAGIGKNLNVGENIVKKK